MRARHYWYDVFVLARVGLSVFAEVVGQVCSAGLGEVSSGGSGDVRLSIVSNLAPKVVTMQVAASSEDMVGEKVICTEGQSATERNRANGSDTEESKNETQVCRKYSIINVTWYGAQSRSTKDGLVILHTTRVSSSQA